MARMAFTPADNLGDKSVQVAPALEEQYRLPSSPPANAKPSDLKPTEGMACCRNTPAMATLVQLDALSAETKMPLLVPAIHWAALPGFTAAERKRRRSKPTEVGSLSSDDGRSDCGKKGRRDTDCESICDSEEFQEQFLRVSESWS